MWKTRREYKFLAKSHVPFEPDSVNKRRNVNVENPVENSPYV